MLQESVFDDFKMPWEYSPDTGAMVARYELGVGEGKYRWAQDPEDTKKLVAELNPSPTPNEEFGRRFDESIRLVVEAVQLELATQRQHECDDSGGSDDSADSNGHVQRKRAHTDGAYSSGDEAIVTCASHATTSNAVPPSHKRQRAVSEPELHLCKITTFVRANSNRTDLEVVTPDGKVFRSKAAALRYMRAA